MRNFTRLMLLVMCALIGMNAQAYTLTVKADPRLVANVEIGSAASSVAPVQFSAEGTVNANLDLTGISIYVRATATSIGKIASKAMLSKEGQADKYTTMALNGNGVSAQPIMLFGVIGNYDGGTITITAEEVAPPPAEYSITVNVSGDASKVQYAMGAAGKVGLNLGANKIKLPKTNTYISFYCVGVTQLYKFAVNGVEKTVQSNQAEGANEYYYIFKAVGDEVVDIETDFPDNDFNITFNCTDYSYLQEVTFDGVEQSLDVEDRTEPLVLTAKAGVTFRFVGDRNNFVVNEMKVNGEVNHNFIYSYSQVIKDDVTIDLDVDKLVRDKSFALMKEGQLALSYTTATNGSFDLTENPATVNYCDAELPIVVYCEFTGSSEPTGTTVIYRNNEFLKSDVRLKLTSENLNPDDVFLFTMESPSFTVNVHDSEGTAMPEGVVMTLYGVETAADAGKYSIKSDQDDSTLKFAAAEGYEITSLTVNDVEKLGTDAEADGVFTLYPANRAVYDVTVEQVATEKVITFNVNNPEGLFYSSLIVGSMELVPLQEGENVIDLNEYEDSSMIMFAATPGEYVITKVLYNGEDVTESSYDEDEGAYFFEDVENGDTFDVTVEAIVLDNKLYVYTSGLANATNPFIAEQTGNIKLHEGDLIDNAYNEIMFANVHNPLQFQADNLHEGHNLFVFLNDDIQDLTHGNHFSCEVAHNDVLKIYVQPEQPEPLGLVFSTDGAQPEVTVDFVRKPFWMGGVAPLNGEDIDELDPDLMYYVAMVLPGTHVSFKAPGEEAYVKVEVDGEEVPQDAEGNFVFSAYDPEEMGFKNVVITTDTMTGIAAVNVAGSEAEYYNLQGMRVTNPETGIYLVRKGGKVVKVVK